MAALTPGRVALLEAATGGAGAITVAIGVVEGADTVSAVVAFGPPMAIVYTEAGDIVAVAANYGPVLAVSVVEAGDTVSVAVTTAAPGSNSLAISLTEAGDVVAVATNVVNPTTLAVAIVEGGDVVAVLVTAPIPPIVGHVADLAYYKLKAIYGGSLHVGDYLKRYGDDFPLFNTNRWQFYATALSRTVGHFGDLEYEYWNSL